MLAAAHAHVPRRSPAVNIDTFIQSPWRSCLLSAGLRSGTT